MRTEAIAVVGTILLIIVLLALAFRAVLAPLVALAPAGLALALAGPLIAESTHLGVDISSLLQLLLTALVLGAGTDYGLFLLFRYRENLATGMSTDEAIVTAGSRVGTSITFSGLTVVCALLSLLLASFGLYRGVGPGLAIGIGIVLLVELTLLPALLSIVGPRLFWPSRLRSGSGGTGVWGRIASRVVRQPVRALVGGVFILGGLSAFLVGYAPSGFNPGGAIAGSDSSLGQFVLEEHFGEIAVGATDVVFRFPSSVWTAPSLLEQAEDGLWTLGALLLGDRSPRRRRPLPPAASAGRASTPPSARRNACRWWTPGRRAVCRPPSTPPTGPPRQYVTEDGRTVLYQTSLRAGSAGSTAAMQAIPSVRAAVSRVARSVGATQWGVAGQAPGAADVSTISGQDVVRILPVVALVLALLLGLLLRSVVAPLYLVASVVLSYTASLGLAVLIFVTIGGQLGINFTLPFFMFVFIMALGEDYNILVMSRIKEETAGLPLRVVGPSCARHDGDDGHDGRTDSRRHVRRARPDDDRAGAPDRDRPGAGHPPRHLSGADAARAVDRGAPRRLELVAPARLDRGSLRAREGWAVHLAALVGQGDDLENPVEGAGDEQGARLRVESHRVRLTHGGDGRHAPGQPSGEIETGEHFYAVSVNQSRRCKRSTAKL